MDYVTLMSCAGGAEGDALVLAAARATAPYRHTCIYIHTHIDTHNIHTYALHTNKHTYVYTYIHTYIRIYIHTCVPSSYVLATH